MLELSLKSKIAKDVWESEATLLLLYCITCSKLCVRGGSAMSPGLLERERHCLGVRAVCVPLHSRPSAAVASCPPPHPATPAAASCLILMDY